MGIPGRAYNILRGYIHREWERIRDAEREQAECELNDVIESPPSQRLSSHSSSAIDPSVRACRILGVAHGASYSEIRKAYARLARRSDPANFPPGSVEAREAEQIQRRVAWAYSVLSENVDPTEKRFHSLEIEN